MKKKQDEIDLLEILIEEYDNRIKKESYRIIKIINSSLNQVTLAKK